MVYILAAEYYRTKRSNLVYKLIAALSITGINIATTILLVLEAFYDIQPSQKVLPLLFNAIFAIIVIALARAFIYEFITRPKVFDLFVKLGIFATILTYAVIQAYWLVVFKPGMIFGRSLMQFFFSVIFLFVLGLSIYYLFRYRKIYRLRLILAFGSIVIAQFVTIYGVFADLSGELKIIRSIAPILVPTMFGSVVFKELIDNVVTLAEHLKYILKDQNNLVQELNGINKDLSGMSEHLVTMSLEGWQKLSEVVEIIYAEEKDRNQLVDLTTGTMEHIADLSGILNFGNDHLQHRFTDVGSSESATNSNNKINEFISRIETILQEGDEIFEGTRSYLIQLEEASISVSDALKSVQDIYGHTTMLSLNASIEAARAGEHGRGFAIVAEKVNELADQSKNSTNNVVKHLQEISTTATESSARIFAGMEKLKSARNLVNQIAEKIDYSNVVDRMIRETRELLADIRKKHIENSQNIVADMNGAKIILQDHQTNGEKMKTAIRNHIRDIEAIAGVSDELNSTVRVLSEKTEEILKKSEMLKAFT